MKVRDLILEARIYQNNFIKVDIIEDELKRIFSAESDDPPAAYGVKEKSIPKVNFDADGMYITMDKQLYALFMQKSSVFVKPDDPSQMPQEEKAEGEDEEKPVEVKKFFLTDAGFVDIDNGIKKYYIEYNIPPKEETENEEGSEEA